MNQDQEGPQQCAQRPFSGYRGERGSARNELFQASKEL